MTELHRGKIRHKYSGQVVVGLSAFYRSGDLSEAHCRAIRNWALAYPHEYALIYGSPVPGYRAPQATIAPATRVARVIGGLLGDGCPETRNGDRPPPPGLPPELAGQAAVVSGAIAPSVPGPAIIRGVIALTQLFGMISFELFGQFTGSFDPADAFFGYAVEQMADFIGL